MMPSQVFQKTFEVEVDRRLTTAPLRDRPRHGDLMRTANIELPAIKPKETPERERIIVSREIGRRREDNLRSEGEHEELHKRPQTSKRSRGHKVESEFYEEGEEDLVLGSIQEKIDFFKKTNKEAPFPKK